MKSLFNFLSCVLVLVIVLSYQACGPSFRVIDVGGESSSSSLLLKNCPVTDSGQVVLRRLSKEEYRYTVQDIFNITVDPTTEFPINQSGTDDFTPISSVQSMNPERTEAFLIAAEKTIGAALAANPSILKCAQGQPGETCVDEVLSKVSHRAWRRPATPEDLAYLKSIFTSSKALIDGQAGYVGNKDRDALAVALQSVLMSPKFLFMVNQYRQDGSLDSYSLSTRLSYFLWVSAPDDQLLTLAKQDALKDPAILRAQVERMIKDPKAFRWARNFSNQWLSLGKLLNTDQVSVDGLTPELRSSLKRETEMLFEAIVQGNLSPTQLMEADFTFVNSTLAQHYGVPGVTGTAFQRVSTASLNRRGLLSQGSLLTLTSGTINTKPTGRGNFILSRITCTPPPPFPDGGVITPLASNDPNLTIRERLAIHRTNTTCVGCHSMMDPIGLGLEKFDQLGRYRTSYIQPAKFIDASGVLLGSSFMDHLGLSSVIVDQGYFGLCFSRKVLSYASGRTIEKTPDDRCLAEKVSALGMNRNSTFTDFVMAVAQSDAFMRSR